MNEKFAAKMQDKDIVGDTITVADFIQIWCDGHHRDRERHAPQTDAAQFGVYDRTKLVLCDECEAHLAYAEKRRAYCPQDPKPFCAFCETHCYKSDEREWQATMMRYSGPRSWRKGYAIEGIKHVLEGRKYKKKAEAARAREAAAQASLSNPTAEHPAGVSANHQEETR